MVIVRLTITLFIIGDNGQARSSYAQEEKGGGERSTHWTSKASIIHGAMGVDLGGARTFPTVSAY